MRIVLAGQLPQEFAGVGQLVDGVDLRGNGAVEPGLGIVNVGDGGQPDLEPPVGLFELAGEGIFFRRGESQVVDRRQHAEVALRHPQDQIVLRVAEVGIGLLDRLLRQPLLYLTSTIVNGLRQTDRVAVSVAGVTTGWHAHNPKGMATRGRNAHARQQQGSGLGFGFLGGLPAGGGGLERGIALQGLTVHLQQIFRPYRLAEQRGDHSGQQQTVRFGHG